MTLKRPVPLDICLIFILDITVEKTIIFGHNLYTRLNTERLGVEQNSVCKKECTLYTYVNKRLLVTIRHSYYIK